MNAISKIVPHQTVALRNLSVLSYAHGFTHWHYRPGEASLHDVTIPGFFDHAGNMVAAGDLITVSDRTGGLQLIVVSSRPAVRVLAMVATP